MSICLFIITNIVKVKVFSLMECVPFVDVFCRRRVEIPLLVMQRNVYFLDKGYAIESEKFIFLTFN